MDSKLEVLEYERVKGDLQHKISSKVLTVGTRLVSERDMAIEYGVSRITIRRALSKLESLDMIYKVPGKGAFVSGHEKTVLNRLISAFCFYDLYTDAFYAEIFSGILQEAHKLGFHLITGKVESDLHSKNMIERLSSEHQTDGSLLIGSIPDQLVEMVQSQGKPIVLVDNISRKRELAAVMGDNASGAYAAVQHLLKLDHKRIAHIMICEDGHLPVSFQERRDAWAKALSDAGITPDEDLLMDWNYVADPDGSAVRGKIRAAMPTAIFCCNDLMAVHIMRLIENMGLNVPTDISVAGFDDTPFAQFASLTTVAVPKKEMGIVSVKRLINQLNGTDFGPLTTVMPVRLITRRSTARSRSEK